MSWYLILVVCCVLVSLGFSAYEVYKMVELDALGKGVKRPKFWGFFALSGGNSSGLLLYLIGSRKYLSTLSEKDQVIMKSRKRRVIVLFSVLAVFMIMLMFILVTQY